MEPSPLILLPPRYAPLRRLGRGGGGEVWAVRDLVDEREYALKTLSEGATEREVLALVREASALSGLEGLGVPRVLRFGRLPQLGRPYLLRELVQGQSLAECLETHPCAQTALLAVVRAADQLTRLHRAALLHGDVKPANIIVGEDGSATLVDLGLASPWREKGQAPSGLTPGYAAPELFCGEPLTVRAEVYSLGATLREVMDRVRSALTPALADALEIIVDRATADDPSARFPSVDELASSLRRAAMFEASAEVGTADAAWPIVGMEGTVTRVLTILAGLPSGSVLHVQGRLGSGRTAVLRRLAWSLGVEGRAVAWIEGAQPAAQKAIQVELAGAQPGVPLIVLVDDIDRVGDLQPLRQARAGGAKLVMTGNAAEIDIDADADAGEGTGRREVFTLPAIETNLAADLVRRAIPSLNESVIAYLVARADGRPGRLRSLVRCLDGQPVVSISDVDRLIDAGAGSSTSSDSLPLTGDDVALASQRLDQGRLTEAAVYVARLAENHTLQAALVRARLRLGQGDVQSALRALAEVKAEVEKAPGSVPTQQWHLYQARAFLRQGAYMKAASVADRALEQVRSMQAHPPRTEGLQADLLACRGVAESFLGYHEQALVTLRHAVSTACHARDRRIEALARGSLALALQRNDRLSEAKRSYEEALEAAEEAGDAGAIATTRLNLAALATHGQGEIAEALQHLQAAVDMGRRAGRASTVQQALLNLANLDLYLGRLAKARASIEALCVHAHELSTGSGQRAQLLGLQAELAARSGEIARATEFYDQCALAYDALGRKVDAAEARIEAVLVAARNEGVEPTWLASLLERASSDLQDIPAHRAALCLARGTVALLAHDEERARQAFGEALNTAREAGQKEWVWRTLEKRSRLELECGRSLAARRDAEEALAMLEDIAARLPRDLREVYWNDPRRRAIRAVVTQETRPPSLNRGDWNVPTSLAETLNRADRNSTRHLQDDRLARILEINRELAVVHELAPVLDRVIQLATGLLEAERGFVLLLDAQGALSVHAARERGQERNQTGGDEPHGHFSKSIAQRAIATGEAVISMSAREDDRLAAFESVHEMRLQSVACVPIRSAQGGAIGALYLETQTRRGVLFEKEIHTLRAFADQAAIAIENARLLEENARRAEALTQANQELELAHTRLKELLHQKKAQLEVTRRDLKDTRAVLHGHFGYQGLVGTSSAMRRVYALIERIKDTDIPVLITGESGTGKEMIARAIHQGGIRAKRPFTGINCGAIPEHLLESELFGHVRGAFTGADHERKGLFRETEGGTLLLDEIGEMQSKMQSGLLRVLQEKKVRPVGGTREEPIDVRVIAATHRDLNAMIREGTFREDLYYRLRVVEVHAPALRERPDDMPALIDYFLKLFAARYRRERGSVSREALRYLVAYPWPGNVRQLENVLLNAWVLSDSSELQVDAFDLSSPSRSTVAPLASSAALRVPAETERSLVSVDASAAKPHVRSSTTDVPPGTLTDHRTLERARIVEALASCNWNRVRAAQSLQIPRRTFYRRLKEYGIQ